jgi:hypothetical protein
MRLSMAQIWMWIVQDLDIHSSRICYWFIFMKTRQSFCEKLVNGGFKIAKRRFLIFLQYFPRVVQNHVQCLALTILVLVEYHHLRTTQLTNTPTIKPYAKYNLKARNLVLSSIKTTRSRYIKMYIDSAIQ